VFKGCFVRGMCDCFAWLARDFFFFFFLFFLRFPVCFLVCLLMCDCQMSGPPTAAEMAARRQAELDKKKKREAEWTQMHPAWFLAIMRNDAVSLKSMLTDGPFDLEQRYVVISDATPLGWATLADRGEIVAMLVRKTTKRSVEKKRTFELVLCFPVFLFG
jgi:hypothetical protein